MLQHQMAVGPQGFAPPSYADVTSRVAQHQRVLVAFFVFVFAN